MKKNLIFAALILFSLIPLGLYLYFVTRPVEIPYVAPKPLEVKREYGIPTEKFTIEKGTISQNLYLGTIFKNYKIEPNNVQQILDNSKDVFDIRKLRLGNAYAVFLDSLRKVHYVVYEQNPADYVVFNFDSLKVSKGRKKIDIQIKTVSGIIKSNLWFTMIDNGVSPLLSNDLSEVYAWTVDFFAIQKGDRFKAIYEEKMVEGKSIGFGKILCAWFESMGKQIYAIPFRQDSTESYFDDKGGSLQREFLKAPLQYSRISSGFTSHRMHPILKVVTTHYGVDYSAPTGTPVRSIGDGRVMRAAFIGASGNEVRIQHNGVYSTAYLHLSKFETGIRVGAQVKQGDVIGYVGSTGLSTGPHLDFRVWKNGSPVNPLKLDAPPTAPIKEVYRKAFELKRDSLMKELEKIKFKEVKENLVSR